MHKVTEKGKAQIGRMDVILRDSHLDTRIKRCILIDVIVPKLEYADGRGRIVVEEVGNSTDGSS